MKLNNQKSGFTLVEVIVSMSIIVMVVFASTNLLVSIIRSNSENTHTLIAYGLSQEGLEAVRNMRDSDWLLGAKFEGVISGSDAKPWGADFSGNNDGKRFYTVDFNYFDTNMSSVSASNLSSMSSPWVLTDITVPSSTDEKTYAKIADTSLYTHEDGDDVVYAHDAIGGKPTLYHRYISVERLPYSISTDVKPSEKFLKMRVTSVVSWKEQVRDKEVRLVTELTDWKP